jgi:co-chaperonin GroES (HSP10)
VGASVRDGNIKNGKGKKCLFHQTVGFTIEWEGEEYLVLLGSEIIGIV